LHVALKTTYKSKLEGEGAGQKLFFKKEKKKHNLKITNYNSKQNKKPKLELRITQT
jgi:hypothetical protein